MGLKGYALAQFLCETVIVMALAAIFFTASTKFNAFSSKEDSKLRSIVNNMSALEIIKQFCSSGGNVDSLTEFALEDGDFATRITAIEIVKDGFPALYRVAVNTERNGYYINDTEVVAYISVY